MEFPTKDKWYRIQEREHTKYPLPKFNEGSWLYVSRVIIRAGYLYSPMDMPEDEALKAAMKLAVDLFNNTYNMSGVLYRRYLSIESPKTETTITEDDLLRVQSVLGLEDRQLLRNLLYEVRGEWWEAKRGDLIKTFWYIDLPQPTSLQIERRVMRYVGEWNSGPGWSSPGEYDPPYLLEWTRQMLYPAHMQFNDNRPKMSSIRTETVYIHPEDIPDTNPIVPR